MRKNFPHPLSSYTALQQALTVAVSENWGNMGRIVELC